MNDSEDILFDEWEDAMLDQLIEAEELALSSIAKTQQQPHNTNPSSSYYSQSQFQPQQQQQQQQQQPLSSFSPPRELSQRTTLFGPPEPHFDKDLEIERLKRELGHATKQIANLEKECLRLKKERDKKEDQPKFVSSKNEEENVRTKCSKTIDRDFGIVGPEHHKISSKSKNGVSSNNPTAETTFKSKGVETDMVSHQEAQGLLSDDLPAYLDLSQKLLAIWGSPTDRKLGSNVISKLLVGCQRDFHILFGCMSMGPPSEMTRKLFANINSSGASLPCVQDCFRTPEAVKVSRLYLALTKIADGTDVSETLMEPLLDLCDMENVVIVHSSLCILHALLKLLLEWEKNTGRSALCSGTVSPLKEFALRRTSWILLDWKV